MSLIAIHDVPAPAKLNLFLHVIGRRADGYHLLQSVFVLIGTNDLSSSKPAVEVYDGLVELAHQAHAAKLCIVVSTVLPRDDPPLPYDWNVLTEEPERQALNQMLLASTEFDAVADVATAMANS